ncbi:leucine-rich repeat-containing protein 15-like [Diachasmimorpha longicaudata]|uniref:leucine-rich repeat-containing protein 15-like n=1 Tax=Diachasmimorpha longicaudata TaxID=58733 RepID=UPI0030B89759
MKTVIVSFLVIIALSVFADEEICQRDQRHLEICRNSEVITRVIHPENYDYVILDCYSNTTVGPNAFKNLNTWELQFVFVEQEPPLMLSISPGSFAGIDYIFHLHIQYANITYTGNPWSDLARINEFKCEGCAFTKIPTDILSSLPNLEKLILDNNRIEVCPENAFIALNKLKYLDLSGENGMTLESGCFNGLEKLQELKINSNSFNLNPGVFNTFNNLPNLNMMGSFEDGVTLSDVFRTFPSLNDFALLHSNLTLEPEIFSGAQSLRQLRLLRNNITNIPKNVFQNLSSLALLNLGENSITTIEPGAFSGMKVFSLVISSIPTLQVIETGTFENLSVDLLNLSHCNISVIKPQAFNGLNASWVDLENNTLTSIGPEDFAGMQTEILILAKNDLTEIAPDAFKKSTMKQLVLPARLLATANKTTWGLPESVILTSDE